MSKPRETGPESYRDGVSNDRARVRGALRTDRPAADVGLALFIAAAVVLTFLWGAKYALILTIAFGIWFLAALAVIRIGGGKGKDALKRAYIATFGWGNWF